MQQMMVLSGKKLLLAVLPFAKLAGNQNARMMMVLSGKKLLLEVHFPIQLH
jgi:hypothetical protein